MITNKKELTELLLQLEPDLIARSKNGASINLATLCEDVVRAYLTEKSQGESDTSQQNQSNCYQANINSDQNSSIDPITDSSNHSLYDPLTGLPNRVFFSQYIEQAIKRASRHQKPFALVFIDIDHFKTINDTHGHLVGDALLTQLTDRIGNTIRQSDVLSRLSGDEFCLLVEELDKSQDILKVIESIQNNINKPFETNDVSIIMTVSVGVSIYPDDATNFADLLHFADLAMYEAKRDGRNSISIFTPELTKKIKHQNKLQKYLVNAIKHNEFTIWMQPELSLKDYSISSMRQIVTLPGADLTTEQAMTEVASRSKKINQLNIELLKSACQLVADYHKEYPHLPRIVLPIYKDFLCSSRCAHLFKEQIAKKGIDGNHLEIEIEEADLVKQCSYGLDNLQQIFKLGCKISLINFGINPSSFELLSSGLIHNIKIDGTLIHRLEKDARSRLLMEAIIDLCEKFSINIVALDINNMSQVRMLKSLGCNGIRGDFLSPAVSITEFENLLKSNERQFDIDHIIENRIRRSGIPPQAL